MVDSFASLIPPRFLQKNLDPGRPTAEVYLDLVFLTTAKKFFACS
jgi:hypothetical protein